MKRILGAAGGVLLAISLSGCATTSEASAQSPSASPTPTKSQIEQALDTCKVKSGEYARIGDGGYTITMQGEPKNSYVGLPVTDLACILKAVKIPDSVVSEIDSTRALDGTQKDSWDKFQASWTYHPDNGLRIILTESKSALP
jgi:ABC-type Fe3+-hydroxamate transport system substrate-binding protein